MTWLRRALDWLCELPFVAALWMLDKLAGPQPETPDDRKLREESERLRRAFPNLYEHEQRSGRR